ncbi:MAG: enoyl-CoA hydratase [Burkholderiaceae bacterium]
MSIRFTVDQAIATLAFNRPEKKNAITAAMYQAAADALVEANANDAVRVIIITGDGEAFTAGNDLEDFLRHPPQGDHSPVAQFMHALRDVAKPVVAAVPGLAIGIGTTLLMHCDLVYASERAKFSLPFTQLGLCPEFGSSVLLPRMAGYQRAAEKLLLGEAFDAHEAERIGLVNRVLAPDQLMPFVEGQAGKLSALPTESLRLTKRLMRADLSGAVTAAMQTETQHFTRMLTEADAKEAFSAFLEKRKPVFR